MSSGVDTKPKVTYHKVMADDSLSNSPAPENFEEDVPEKIASAFELGVFEILFPDLALTAPFS